MGINMNTRAYETGFCKAASDAGVNPDVLVKVALNINSNSLSDILTSLSDGYKRLDPAVRHGILGGLAGGIGTFALSNGDVSQRLLRTLAIGGLSGLGTYGLSRTGYVDRGSDWLQNNFRKLKSARRHGLYA